MNELARTLALVADDERSRVEPVEPAEAFPTEDRVDARAGQARLPGEAMRPDPSFASTSAQPGDEFGAVLPGLMMNRARAVGQDPVLGPVPPLRARLATDARGIRRSGDRPARSNPVGQERPSVRVQTGVRMGHRGLLLRLWLRHQQPRIGALSPSTT
jgi:hypothetical protein